MKADELFVLMLALRHDVRLRYRSVYEAVHGERAWRILNQLKAGGAIEHVAYDHWRITEKGRIAAALAIHKDQKLAKAFQQELS